MAPAPKTPSNPFALPVVLGVTGLLLLFALMPSWAAAGSDKAGRRLVEAVLQEYIIPSHERLEDEARKLTKAGVAFCQDPDASGFRTVRQHWEATMRSWSALAPVRYGPVEDFNMTWRFQFWPDPINLVHRKFKSRISGRNTANSAEALNSASVAIQGLSALEYLLFDPELGRLKRYVEEPHLCRILVSTAQNLSRNAQRISEAWRKDYRGRWLDDRDLTDPGTALRLRVEAVYGGVVLALGSITHDKLGKPLSISRDQPPVNAKSVDRDSARQVNRWQLESWRSQTSLEQIRAAVRASWQVYLMENGLSDYMMAGGTENQALDKRIRRQFEAVQQALEAFDQSAFQLLQERRLKRLEALHGAMHRLYHSLKIDYARAAGIRFRFNARDGD